MCTYKPYNNFYIVRNRYTEYQKEHIKTLIDNNTSVSRISKMLQIPISTVYKFKRDYEIEKQQNAIEEKEQHNYFFVALNTFNEEGFIHYPKSVNYNRSSEVKSILNSGTYLEHELYAEINGINSDIKELTHNLDKAIILLDRATEYSKGVNFHDDHTFKNFKKYIEDIKVRISDNMTLKQLVIKEYRNYLNKELTLLSELV